MGVTEAGNPLTRWKENENKLKQKSESAFPEAYSSYRKRECGREQTETKRGNEQRKHEAL